MMMIGNMTTLTLSIILIITLMNCVFTTNKQQQNTQIIHVLFPYKHPILQL